MGLLDKTLRKERDERLKEELKKLDQTLKRSDSLFRYIYEDEIELFFTQTDPQFKQTRERGHVWIAGQHRQFQTLTIEPPDGGQYEIAVRFPLEDDWPNPRDKFSGYIAENGYMVGRNTSGH